MKLLEYNLTHPYPHGKIFTITTVVLIVLVLPVLILVNVVTVGYELVPSLQPEFEPNNTVPSWWNVPYLPRLLRREAPSCEPKDIGRGDTFRLTSSLFEYKVMSSWNTTSENPTSRDEGRIPYLGGSFDQCYVDNMVFDFNLGTSIQSLKVAIECPEALVRVFMETRVDFAFIRQDDYIGRYYGYTVNELDFIDRGSRDYRQSVFAVFDIMSTDSLGILQGEHTDETIFAFTVGASFPTNDGILAEVTSVRYSNGTLKLYGNDSLGEIEIYRSTISNIMHAVEHAVELDLGYYSSYNIFINSSAVNSTFSPNLPPPSVNASMWSNRTSFSYGRIVPPYRTWAEMLRAGMPQNITLGGLTGFPPNSKMSTNYLCPTYQLKQMGSFLTSIFVGTATMFLSVWAAWTFVSAILARYLKKPCFQCTCDPTNLDPEKAGGQDVSTSVSPRPSTPSQTLA
ncbi:Transmembrane protein [Ceratobasidium theobromae]|uniref:Transmembrane protein n=1 Tax=Ceratobasidium theobromae TaxID=1582974 RepID=A0A5N5QTU3_9AGAM|nr:Transmembrane protein [Ceratobasidium theobromae]